MLLLFKPWLDRCCEPTQGVSEQSLCKNTNFTLVGSGIYLVSTHLLYLYVQKYIHVLVHTKRKIDIDKENGIILFRKRIHI